MSTAISSKANHHLRQCVKMVDNGCKSTPTGKECSDTIILDIGSKLEATEVFSKEVHKDTIPEVPKRLHIGETDAYKPRIISIGPYYRAKERLQSMEKHKLGYLQSILSRNPDCSLKDYLKGLEELEMKARSCYSETDELNSKQFVEMMLLDGCFIIEFLLRLKEKTQDELHSKIWMVPQIQYDLLLLENQLPYFILQHIFDLATNSDSKRNQSSLVEVALHGFKMFGVSKMFLVNTEMSAHLRKKEPIHHLLHLYYLSLVIRPSASTCDSQSSNSSTGFTVPESENYSSTIYAEDEETTAMIPCATELEEAGIKFRKKEVKGGRIYDIEFLDGVMRIPPVFIDSFTMYQFRNLITFEQLCPNMKPMFTTYVLFLDYLVNTDKDVALLHDEGILEHLLGSNQDVALLFNNLTRATFRPTTHYLCGMYKEVNKYCKAKRHRWRAALVHNYFNTPWAVLSLVAAVILLVLTFVQTLFSVYAYVKPPL